MKGDFTGIRRWPAKHYTSVRMQQGRVQLDTDWNDQVEIQRHLERTEAVDVIGPAGGPKGPGGGFRIDRTGDGQDLTISPGRFYVDGLLCELKEAATYRRQPDLAVPPFVDASGALALPDGTFLAYLDVFERHVTALEDPELRDPALRGADTTTRTQVVWQVRLLQVTDRDGTAGCDAAFPEWPPPGTTGKLAARATVPDAGAGRCTVESTGGYRRLENQLYRVEIHQGGSRAQATFKWSRENGSVVAGWTKLTGDVVEIDHPGRDRVLGFAEGDWVELTDDERERAPTPGVLVKLKKVEGTALTIDPATFDPPGTVLRHDDFAVRPKVRRWEGDLPTARSAARPLVPTPPGDGWIDLEDGVQVRFEDGAYRSGDHWAVPARAALGDVVWPVDPSTKAPVPGPPVGVEHHLARLALVRKAGASLTVTSCYPEFPPLTDLAASDVSFDSSQCAFIPPASSVQEAIDALCKRAGGGPCVVVDEKTSLQAVFDELARRNVQSASVCLTPGTWTLDRPVVVKLSGHLLLSGAGAGTRVVAPRAEAALVFQGARSVTVRDLHVETGLAGAGRGEGALERLNGTLDFQACEAVTVEAVSARCGAALYRAAACITIRSHPEKPPGTSARVRGCDLSVGHRQVGVLLVDVARARVEDSTIAVWERPPALALDRALRQDRRYRAALRRRLLAGLRIARDTPDERVRAARRAGATTVAFAMGGHLVTLEPDGPAAPVLGDTIREVATRLGAATEVVDLRGLATGGGRPPPPTGGRPVVDRAVLRALRTFAAERMPEARVLEALRRVVTPLALRRRLDQLADAILLARGGPRLRAWFDALVDGSPSAASQGIAIGGRRAGEVRVEGNTIAGVLQGVHAGVSHGTAMHMGGSLWIRDNAIAVVQPLDWHGERHGVFAGNFESVVVDGNRLGLERHAREPIDGIRVWGRLGPRVLVTGNAVDRFTRSIWVHPLNPGDAAHALWLVSRNVCNRASQPVVPETGVRTDDLNIP